MNPQTFTKNSPFYAPPPPSTHDTIVIDTTADLADVRAQALAFNRAKESRPKLKFNDGSRVDFTSHLAKFDRATNVRGMDERAKITELAFYFDGSAGGIIDSLATQTDSTAAYAKIRTKLQTFYGKQADSLNEMVDKTMNGRRVSRGDATAHTALLSELYRIDVAANERPDVSESRKREWITRLLQTRLEYMKESFHEEENKRVRIEGKTEFSFTDFVVKLEMRIQTLGQMGKPSTSARIAAVDTSTAAKQPKSQTNSNANSAPNSYPNSSSTCFFCRQNHETATCPAYTQLSADARARKIRENRLCFHCLESGHISKNCTSNPVCEMCSGRHITSLHNQTEFTSARPRQRRPTDNNYNNNNTGK